MTANRKPPKKLNISNFAIEKLARGCQFNNPVAHALKKQFPKAKEIIVTEDAVFVDGAMLEPTLEMTRFIKAWNQNKPVKACILGYHAD